MVLTLPWLPGLWPPHKNWGTDRHCCCLGAGSAHSPPMPRACSRAVFQPWHHGCRALPCWGSTWCLAFVLTVFHEAAVNPFFQMSGSLMQALLALKCQVLHFPVDFLQTSWVCFACFTKSLTEMLRKPSCCEIISVSASAYLDFETVIIKAGNPFWYL